MHGSLPLSPSYYLTRSAKLVTCLGLARFARVYERVERPGQGPRHPRKTRRVRRANNRVFIKRGPRADSYDAPTAFICFSATVADVYTSLPLADHCLENPVQEIVSYWFTTVHRCRISLIASVGNLDVP